MENPYVSGIVASIAIYFSLLIVRRTFCSQVAKIQSRALPRLDDVLIYTFSHTTHIFMLTAALYTGFQFCPEHKIYPTWSWRVFFVVMMIQISIWGSHLIKRWLQLSFSKRRKRDPASASSINIVELMVKFSFFSMILMFTLNNMGIKVTTMIAGLGIGGVAIALAMQNILGDLFSSLSIILDKPFVVGDFIIMGEYKGEVENIGLKTTKIRSLSGEQIIISNSDLLGSRIRNMKRMVERRNVFLISLPHDSSAPTLQDAVEIIKASIATQPLVRFERCHFFRVTPTSLDIETVYFIMSDDYNVHMDIQEKILLNIHRIFLQEKIPYACPVQKLHFSSENPYSSGGALSSSEQSLT